MTDNNRKNFKIFKLNRIKFEELWEDAQSYIKQTYKAIQQAFTPASPFGQILQVVLHLGRMILYYIEDSITGLNIRTAYRPDQIRGLAQLAGHRACRPIASRGAIKISYFNNNTTENQGAVCYIPNKIKVTSKINGSVYTILFGADHAKITMTPGNYINASIIAGTIKYQSATASGQPLQSFNFVERNYSLPDEYYLNIYVNGQSWDTVDNLVDLGFQQKGCVVRTGINNGIDVFFGNGAMGAIPEEGATIIIEYIVSDGITTNIDMHYENTDNFWQFNDTGFLEDGTTVNLNNYFNIKLQTDLIFGSAAEDIQLTQLLAPHTSRAFVLANETNYRYFFKRMNMFSEIEVSQGTANKTGLTILNLAYTAAQEQYEDRNNAYEEQLAAVNYDTNHPSLQLLKEMKDYAYNTLLYAEKRLQDSIYVDNTVHIMLIPDIKKRIASSQNYFNCDKSLFTLSENEIQGLLDMIEESGQKIITVDNQITGPTVVNFAINVYAKIYSDYSYNDVYNSGLAALSKYLLNWKKRDTIPVSDIIALFENEVTGIDSVRVQFIADVANAEKYASDDFEYNELDAPDKFYGVDPTYGDIILYRYTLDNTGDQVKVTDLMPLFRGGFNGTDGHTYQIEQTSDTEVWCPFNLIIQDNNIVNKTLSLDHAVI